VRAVVAVALVAVVVGGCGGTKRLAKADFVKQADAVCKDVTSDLERTTRDFTQDPTDPNTPDDVLRRDGQALEKAGPTLREHLKELRKLHPPKDAQDDWDGYLRQTGTAVDRFDALSHRMASGDRHAATEFDSLAALTAKGDAWARGYGLKVCGQT
jgi:hypothetical protein